MLRLSANLKVNIKSKSMLMRMAMSRPQSSPKKLAMVMDERILEATRQAKFVPAKNEKGIPYAAWGQFVITLELE